MFNRNRLLIHCMTNLHNIFVLKALWILLALLSSLHFQASLWLKVERFLLGNNFTLICKHNFALSIFFSSCFLSRTRLQNFLLTNLTIKVCGLPLPILWYPSISLLSTSEINWLTYIEHLVFKMVIWHCCRNSLNFKVIPPGVLVQFIYWNI